MPSCGSNGFEITAIGIQCPALFQGDTEIAEVLSCVIQIQEADPGYWDHYPERVTSRPEITCSMKSNDLTEVAIDPPHSLPGCGGAGVRIKAEVGTNPMFHQFLSFAIY